MPLEPDRTPNEKIILKGFPKKVDSPTGRDAWGINFFQQKKLMPTKFPMEFLTKTGWGINFWDFWGGGTLTPLLPKVDSPVA